MTHLISRNTSECSHADVVKLLLEEGADPLAVDAFHYRTALHYACMTGHAECVRILCSDSTTVTVNGSSYPLRDAVLEDMQVRTAKFLDQRSFGGLTALHYATVSGDLDTVMELLRAGASIMVKTDGEAYIGDDFLTPGSTPLHVAVLLRSVPMAHALIQAHSDMMLAIAGTSRDERRRRPWEGHSRTDIRSVRNTQRRLPYHLARDRGWTQLMQLVDPRIPADYALDAVRDMDQCRGPKRLATICSLVMQQSLLQWLDQYEKEAKERQETKRQRLSTLKATDEPKRSDEHASKKLEDKRGHRRGWSIASLTGLSGRGQEPACTTSMGESSGPASTSCSRDDQELNQEEGSDGCTQSILTPFAVNYGEHDQLTSKDSASREVCSQDSLGGLNATSHSRLMSAASAPVTPRDIFGSSVGNEGHEAHAGVGYQASGSLHTYVGMLSERRPLSLSPPVNSYPVLTAHGSECQDDRHEIERIPEFLESNLSSQSRMSGPPLAPHGERSIQVVKGSPTRLPRSYSLNILHSSSENREIAAATGRLGMREIDVVAGRSAAAEGTADAAVSHRTPPSQQQAVGGMMRALSQLRDRLRSVEPSESVAIDAANVEMDAPFLSGDDSRASHTDDPVSPTSCKCDAAHKCCTDSDSASLCGSSYLTDGDGEMLDVECGVCLDRPIEVAFAGCSHALCVECARNLTKQEKKPPVCPFCRQMVVGFRRVSCI